MHRSWNWRIAPWILLLPCWFGREPQGFAGEDGAIVNLLRDPAFTAGFTVLKPEPGKRVVQGRLAPSDATNEPAWFLDQWNSRSPITNLVFSPLPSGGLTWSNNAKWVAIHPPNSDRGDLVLGVDSAAEYAGGPRTRSSQPWVHLLVEQDIDNCPYLSEIKRLDFHLEARLIESKRHDFAGHTTALHAAQVQFVMIVQNRRSGSPGYGDFLWFVVPLYDDRYPLVPPYVAQDFADPAAKLIYNPGAAAFMSSGLEVGRWATLDVDLYPQVRKALETAWTKGYLRGSTTIADYRIIEANFGWEVPGMNRVAIEIRKLRLQAIRSGP